MQHNIDTESLRLNPTLLTRWSHTGWLRKAQDGGRPSKYWKDAILLLFTMPSHHLMYANMCQGNNNKLKIYPKGTAISEFTEN